MVKIRHAYWKSLRRDIRHSLSRFLAIFAIVALGVGFLAGLMSTAPDMRRSVDAFYDGTRLMDLRVASAAALSNADAESVRAVEGVSDVLPACAADALVSLADGEEIAVRLAGQPLSGEAGGAAGMTAVNGVVLLEGRLPERPGECLLQRGRGISKAGIGDTLSLTADNTGLAAAVSEPEFTVVGIVNSPLYFSMEREPASVGNGLLAAVLFVDPSVFPEGVYTDLYVTVEGAAALDSFSTGYADRVSPVAERIADLGQKAGAAWLVLDRDALLSAASIRGNANKVEAIAKVFPIFFFLVAALVSLTTMTRMVEEHRTQIGTMMALGYGKGSVAARSLLYAAAASVLGSVFGLLLGLRVFPTVIWNAYGIMYVLPGLVIGFPARISLLSSMSAILCTMLATWAACADSVRERPARLLLPRAPKPGRRVFLERIPWLWNPMRFTYKVTVRNLLRYKKRFFMTVFGIAGCTALLLAGFGLRDAIGGIVSRQFGAILRYDLTIDLADARLLETPALRDLLESSTTDHLAIHQENGSISLDGRESALVMTVPQETGRLRDFIVLRDRRSGAGLALDETHVILSEKLASEIGARTGSQVTIRNAAGVSAVFTVGGVTENYVYHFAYLSPGRYAAAFGSEPACRRVVATVSDTSQANRDETTAALLQVDGVRSVQFIETIVETFSNIIGNIDYIVVVIILTAGLLAFIVLYNLTNINISERTREIATIKVLGFHDGEVSAYIYRETAVLAVIGAVLGLGIGVFLDLFVVRTAEVDMVMFERVIKPASFFLALALTLGFSLLVNLFMYRKLKRIDITESMKSGE